MVVTYDGPLAAVGGPSLFSDARREPIIDYSPLYYLAGAIALIALLIAARAAASRIQEAKQARSAARGRAITDRAWTTRNDSKA